MSIHCVIAKSDISTHAHTEGDHNLPVSHHCSLYFNSRPHGGRREPYYHANQTGKFQLTPSRRATVIHSSYDDGE